MEPQNNLNGVNPVSNDNIDNSTSNLQEDVNQSGTIIQENNIQSSVGQPVLEEKKVVVNPLLNNDDLIPSSLTGEIKTIEDNQLYETQMQLKIRDDNPNARSTKRKVKQVKKKDPKTKIIIRIVIFSLIGILFIGGCVLLYNVIQDERNKATEVANNKKKNNQDKKEETKPPINGDEPPLNEVEDPKEENDNPPVLEEDEKEEFVSNDSTKKMMDEITNNLNNSVFLKEADDSLSCSYKSTTDYSNIYVDYSCSSEDMPLDYKVIFKLVGDELVYTFDKGVSLEDVTENTVASLCVTGLVYSVGEYFGYSITDIDKLLVDVNSGVDTSNTYNNISFEWGDDFDFSDDDVIMSGKILKRFSINVALGFANLKSNR